MFLFRAKTRKLKRYLEYAENYIRTERTKNAHACILAEDTYIMCLCHAKTMSDSHLVSKPACIRKLVEETQPLALETLIDDWMVKTRSMYKCLNSARNIRVLCLMREKKAAF